MDSEEADKNHPYDTHTHTHKEDQDAVRRSK